MKIEITEKELNDIFKGKILQHFKQAVDDNQLGYWVRSEVYRILSEKVANDLIKDAFPKEKLEEMMKDAFTKYVEERF